MLMEKIKGRRIDKFFCVIRLDGLNVEVIMSLYVGVERGDGGVIIIFFHKGNSSSKNGRNHRQ